MDSRYLTVVLKNPNEADLEWLKHHERLSAMSWSHAMDDRDEARAELKRIQEGAKNV